MMMSRALCLEIELGALKSAARRLPDDDVARSLDGLATEDDYREAIRVAWQECNGFDPDVHVSVLLAEFRESKKALDDVDAMMAKMITVVASRLGYSMRRPTW